MSEAEEYIASVKRVVEDIYPDAFAFEGAENNKFVDSGVWVFKFKAKKMTYKLEQKSLVALATDLQGENNPWPNIQYSLGDLYIYIPYSF